MTTKTAGAGTTVKRVAQYAAHNPLQAAFAGGMTIGAVPFLGHAVRKKTGMAGEFLTPDLLGYGELNEKLRKSRDMSRRANPSKKGTWHVPHHAHGVEMPEKKAAVRNAARYKSVLEKQAKSITPNVMGQALLW